MSKYHKEKSERRAHRNLQKKCSIPRWPTSRRMLTLQSPHCLHIHTSPSSLCPARSDTSTMRGIRSQMRFGKRSAYCKDAMKDSRVYRAGTANGTRLRQDEIQKRRSHGKDI